MTDAPVGGSWRSRATNWLAPGAAVRRTLGLRWWKEVALLAVFYLSYTWVRNQFGSAAVGPEVALRNAENIIDLERALGIYRELDVQQWFIDWTAFIQFWNLFYGLFHFLVTYGVLIALYVRWPSSYRFWRTAGVTTTGLGIVGFALFPLMPPRLLDAGPPYGGGLDPTGYVDTVREIGGIWSFESGTIEALSNQYAAMPSLHFGWALWSTLALCAHLRRRVPRLLAIAYPALTTFAIVVTANHYVIDAAGGAVAVAVGLVVARVMSTRFSPEVGANGEKPARVEGADGAAHTMLGSDGS